jgi:hypothetical protein
MTADAQRPATTTIQLMVDTKEELNALKESNNMGTYDDVIRFLINTRKTAVKSLFGCTPEMTPFTREEDDSHRVPGH